MNIPISIQVVTVVSSETGVNYQQVYVNNEDAAQADFDRQKVIHKVSCWKDGLYHLDAIKVVLYR